jgi:uncharacterized membrane protein
MIVDKVRQKWILWSFIILGGIGFADAFYLTYQHYSGAPIPCSLLKGCEAVTSSAYAVLAGVPVALLGVFYYSSITILVLAAAFWRNRLFLLRYAAFLTPLGFTASLWFVYAQLFVLKAICIYCMLSATTSTLLFALGLFVMLRRKALMV